MILIIIDDSILGEALKCMLELQGEEVSFCSHQEALETFILEEPDSVLIFECVEFEDGKALSVQTTEDIRNSADANAIVKTIGFDGHAFGGECDILIGDVLLGTDALLELVKALRR